MIRLLRSSIELAKGAGSSPGERFLSLARLGRSRYLLVTCPRSSPEVVFRSSVRRSFTSSALTVEA